MTEKKTLRNTSAEELQDHCDALVNELKARGFSHHDAEDSVMEALAKELEASNVIDRNAWLFRTAYNYAIALRRKQKITAKHKKALAYHAARIREEGAPNPLTEAARHEEAEIVLKMMAEALAVLTDLDREILTRRVERGLTSRN